MNFSFEHCIEFSLAGTDSLRSGLQRSTLVVSSCSLVTIRNVCNVPTRRCYRLFIHSHIYTHIFTYMGWWWQKKSMVFGQQSIMYNSASIGWLTWRTCWYDDWQWTHCQRVWFVNKDHTRWQLTVCVVGLLAGCSRNKTNCGGFDAPIFDWLTSARRRSTTSTTARWSLRDTTELRRSFLVSITFDTTESHLTPRRVLLAANIATHITLVLSRWEARTVSLPHQAAYQSLVSRWIF